MAGSPVVAEKAIRAPKGPNLSTECSNGATVDLVMPVRKARLRCY